MLHHINRCIYFAQKSTKPCLSFLFSTVNFVDILRFFSLVCLLGWQFDHFCLIQACLLPDQALSAVEAATQFRDLRARFHLLASLCGSIAAFPLLSYRLCEDIWSFTLLDFDTISNKQVHFSSHNLRIMHIASVNHIVINTSIISQTSTHAHL